MMNTKTMRPLDPISTAPPEVLEESNVPGDTQQMARGPGVNHLLPYNILTQCATIPNKNQNAWWCGVIPSLVTFLSIAKYRVSVQYHWLRFVRDHVLPYLDAPPHHDQVPKWKSSLIPFYIPIQLSMHHQGNESTVRLVFEPIGSTAGTPSDPYNRAAASEAMELLARELDIVIDSTWFYFFKSELTLSDLEADCLQPTEIRDVERSQVFLSLEFGNALGEASMKAFFVPHLKSLATGISTEQLGLGAIRKADVAGRFTDSLTCVEQYLNTCNRDTQDVVLFGSEMMDSDKSSITIYLAEWEVEFDKVRDFFTLNNTRRNSASTMAGVADMRQLWNELNIPEGNQKDAAENSKPPGLPLLFSFELQPSDPEPRLKVFIPLHGLKDKDTAVVLAKFYERYGWSYMGSMPGRIDGILE